MNTPLRASSPFSLLLPPFQKYLIRIPSSFLEGPVHSFFHLESEASALALLACVCDGFLEDLHVLAVDHCQAALVGAFLSVSVELGVEAGQKEACDVC